MTHRFSYKMPKAEAARRAAAKHAIHPANATREYMILTGLMEQLPQDQREIPGEIDDRVPNKKIHLTIPDTEEKMPELFKAAQIYADAEKEMLNSICAYRHPANNAFAERMIFFAKWGLEGNMIIASNPPCWYQELEELFTIPEHLNTTILQYINDSDKTKGNLNRVTAELAQKNKLLNAGKKAYEALVPGESDVTRARDLARILGFAQKPGRPTKNHDATYTEYIHLIRHKGESRHNAAAKVAKMFSHKSEDAALKSLQQTKASIVAKWKQDSLQIFNELNIKRYFKGLVPQRR